MCVCLKPQGRRAAWHARALRGGCAWGCVGKERGDVRICKCLEPHAADTTYSLRGTMSPMQRIRHTHCVGQ